MLSLGNADMEGTGYVSHVDDEVAIVSYHLQSLLGLGGQPAC